MNLPNINDIISASLRIKEYIHRTPIMSSAQINEICNCEIFFKCENFQKAGSFKMRGASNAVFSLSEEQAQKGVATHSSGNFAQALALAAKLRGISAKIVMPENAPKAKKAAVKGYGAEVYECYPSLDARESTLNEILKEYGSEFLHPYDNFNVIAGQGTACLEIADEMGDVFDIVMSPVGGGGLISGTAIAAKALTKAKVIAAEPHGADDAHRTFYSDTFYPSKNPQTIADGLLTSLGELNLPIIREKVDDILLAEDETIVKAMKLVWERMKIIIEPSSAVPLATILENPKVFRGKKVAVIISGGNLDLEKLPWMK